MSHTTEYVARVTGKHWKAYQGVYYDCHTVAAAQILPQELFQPFMLISAACRIERNWAGLTCRSYLDSEQQRDVVLFNDLGVDKYLVPISGVIEANIQSTVRSAGHCICRMDAYYHPYFDEFYGKQHKPGHKSTIIDWDDDAYYAMDSVGTDTFLMRFERPLFLEALRSNIFDIYDKEDSFFYLHAGDNSLKKLQSGAVAARVDGAIRDFVLGRQNLIADLNAYAGDFARDLEDAPTSIRRKAQIRNSYTTALQVEISYGALLEAYQYDRSSWERILPRAGLFMERLQTAVKGWRVLKMLCKGMETTDRMEARQPISALRRLVVWEQELQEAIQ